MGKELLLEIGTEEIPAGLTPTALKSLADLMIKELGALEASFGELRTLGTPRRLVISVRDVSEFQKETVERRLGPPKHLAFDTSGNPTKAAVGFAKSLGVRTEDLETVSTDRGEYLCSVRRRKGGKTSDSLKKMLPRVITSIPFLKSMRWGDSALRFVRPIHWILALFDGQVIPFQLEEVESGDLTYGHRFMGPGPFKVKSFDHYLKTLQKAWVIADPGKRKSMIEEGIGEAAQRVTGRILLDSGLLDEVTFLVEYPVIVLGEFEKDFLSLPKEVIVHAMEDHQRYFPVVDSEGTILPHFVCVSNTRATDMDVVKRGNERVLRARLSDARFFYQEDTKLSLEKRVDALKNVVFQTKLGTSFEKVMRFRSLARFLARKLEPEIEKAVDRAALLCKADLVTGMVGEFPSLQGIIGREYALLSGEPEGVAKAIAEHYLPAFAGDRLPSSPVGDFVSIADKLDTITGCFGVGLTPTGAGDPFGLRRQALGILNILLEKRYRISLSEIIAESLKLLGEKTELPPGQIANSVREFFKNRFGNFLISRNNPQDVVEAALEAEFDDVADSHDRIAALVEIKGTKEFIPLAAAFKRVVNITKDHAGREVAASLCHEKAEIALHEKILEVTEKVDELLTARDYRGALGLLTKLKKPVDSFFDQVLVMDKDERIRRNRLALLGRIVDLFSRIADFSKIETE
jgi:glycyl-tRNA synthetase beta chain